MRGTLTRGGTWLNLKGLPSGVAVILRADDIPIQIDVVIGVGSGRRINVPYVRPVIRIIGSKAYPRKDWPVGNIIIVFVEELNLHKSANGKRRDPLCHKSGAFKGTLPVFRRHFPRLQPFQIPVERSGSRLA